MNKRGYNGVRLSEVYELVDNMRKELLSSVNRLETKFDNLESGRLTALELRQATVASEFEPIKRLVYGLISTILLGIVSAVLLFLLKK